MKPRRDWAKNIQFNFYFYRRDDGKEKLPGDLLKFQIDDASSRR